MKILAFVILLCTTSILLQAQGECAVIPYYQNLLRAYPGLQAAESQYLQRLNTWLRDHPYDPELHQIPITIPVVIHVVHKNDAENNQISDQVIRDQMTAMNQHYNKTTTLLNTIPDPFKRAAFNCLIQFQLVKINRFRTSLTVPFSDVTDNVKIPPVGYAAMDPDKYLNIWVASITNWCGYAVFPEWTNIPKERHGVVVDMGCFGVNTFKKGTTLSHEVGHYLGLRHIWGDSPGCSPDDLVADTPPQDVENTGACPTHPHVTCSNGGDMFSNMMDYSLCRCMFTSGQAQRMWGNLNYGGARSILTRSPALGFTAADSRDFSQIIEDLILGNPYGTWPAWKASLALVHSTAHGICVPAAEVDRIITAVASRVPARLNGVPETIRATIAALALDPEELLMSYTPLGFRNNVLDRRSPIAMISTSGTEVFGIVITGVAREGDNIRLKIYDPMNNGPRIAANCPLTNSGIFKIANYTDFMQALDNAVIGGKRIFIARPIQ